MLHRFTSLQGDGAIPYAGLTFDSAGNLYGTTVGGGDLACAEGGGGGCGVVFKLTPTSSGWSETLLHSFSGSYGAYPIAPVTFDGAGNLYGTTGRPVTTPGGTTTYGLVFEITP